MIIDNIEEEFSQEILSQNVLINYLEDQYDKSFNDVKNLLDLKSNDIDNIFNNNETFVNKLRLKIKNPEIIRVF